jgi:DNA-directed RNA polymerase specialized sigma subunit
MEIAYKELWDNRPKSTEELIDKYLYMTNHTDKENLSDAFLGLHEAITKFDPNKGIMFEKFAPLYIKGRVTDGVRQEKRLRGNAIISKKMKEKAKADQLYKETGIREHSSTFYIQSIDGKADFGDEDKTLLRSLSVKRSLPHHSLCIKELEDFEYKVYTLVTEGHSLLNVSERLGTTEFHVTETVNSIYSKFSGNLENKRIIDPKANRKSGKNWIDFDKLEDFFVSDVFDCLSERDKKIITLIVQGYTFAKICKIFNMTPSGIGAVYKRCMDSLTDENERNKIINSHRRRIANGTKEESLASC